MGGKVVVTSSTALRFHVDPHTAVVGDGGVPECFVTIDAVKSGPGKYADPSNPGWCMQIEFVRVK
jgi:hypothetical protein